MTVQTDVETGYKTVYYYKFIPILIEAIKEQQEIIDDQNKMITEFKQKAIIQQQTLDNVLKRLEEVEKEINK